MCQSTPEPRRARTRRARPKVFPAGMARLLRGCRHRLDDAAKDDRGMVAILAAVSLPVLVLLAGGANDYARSLDARTRLQTALDAALLATANHRMNHPDMEAKDLQKYFRERLKGEYERRLKNRKLTLNVNKAVFKVEGDKLVAEVSGSFRTAFLSMIGFTGFSVKVRAATQTGFSRLEVALVLDVSGSMGKEGNSDQTKIEELKQAAKEFIDILHERFAEADAEMVRVAIVPFSQYVNVGRNKKRAYWLQLEPGSLEEREALNEHKIRWKGCVGSRKYPYNLIDGKYTLYPIPTVMNYPRKVGMPANDPESYVVEKDYFNYCPPAITPLTSVVTDDRTLKDSIDALGAGGWTYIPAGLIWGWRVLSGNAPFREGAKNHEVKAKNIRRIIILMSDGANTRAPGDGSTWPTSEHQADDRELADRYTRKICAKLRKTNAATGRPRAEVITVAFNITYDQDRIRGLLRECASLGMHEAKIGELTEVFKNIADQISDLYLLN